MITDEEYGELKQRVHHLEYDTIKSINEDVMQIKLSLKENEVLVDQSVDAYKKMSHTMDTVKDTMVEMAQSLKDSNRITSELTNTVSSLNEKIDETNEKMHKKFKEYDDKIDTIDDKSKVDIVVWLKTNWFAIIGAGGLAYTIITQLLHI